MPHPGVLNQVDKMIHWVMGEKKILAFSHSLSVCVCVCVYIYIHTHTHMHMYVAVV